MKDLVRQLLCRPIFQPFLSHLLKLCHAGMNFGGGQAVHNSGEIGALDFVLRSAPATFPFLLIDVGANDGDYLSMAIPRLPQAFRAFALEPQSSSFAQLQARFATDPRIHLCKTAAGSEVGSVNLFFGEGESTSSLHGTTGTSETVPITTIDQLCREEQIDQITFLKIDTEGHEVDVLLGAAEALRAGRIFAIQFEFGDPFIATRHHFADLWALVTPQYRVFRILRTGLYELTRYSTDDEIYKISNFLCIRR